MEAFKNLLNQLEIQKAEQRQREAEEATKQNELRKAQVDLSLDVLHPFCWTMKWNSP
ncbi:hypothetical protein MP963_23510 [Escherichia coli]|nr:hypothetical protein [Escherichia coli]